MESQNTTTKYQQILGQLNIVDVALSTYNGYVRRNDVETDDLRTAGSLRVMDPKHTNIFTATRQAVRRSCLAAGVSFLGATAVPDEAVEALAKKISVMGEKYLEGKNFLVNNYDQLLAEWAAKHQGFEAEILKRAPKVDYVAGQINFGLRIFKVIPQSEKVIQCGATDGLESDLRGLTGQLVSEIAKEVKENWSNSASGSAGIKSVGFLKRILTKVKSLSFIDTRVAEIGIFIEETINKFPSGQIKGHDYLVFSGLMSILSNEKMLMSGNLSITTESSPAIIVPTIQVATTSIFSGSLFPSDMAAVAELIEPKAQIIAELAAEAEDDVKAESAVDLLAVEAVFVEAEAVVAQVETIADAVVESPEVVLEPAYAW